MSAEASRRTFVGQVLTLLPTYGLLHFLFERRLLAEAVAPAARQWLVEINECSAALSGRLLRPLEWQQQVGRLFARVPLSELLRLTDFERLTRQVGDPGPEGTVQPIRFPEVEGLPSPTAFGRKLFALRKGDAIVPHGHRNMVSMHVVLAGEFHLRQFDRVADEPGHLLIRPTMDRVSRPGEASSISSERDNVHWFVARTERAYTLDIIVDGLDPSLGFPYAIDFVDPLRAEPVGGGLLRARTIAYAEARQLYGGP